MVIFNLLFFLSGISYAQKRTIEGVVSTFDSIPLIKAEVKVISTKQTTLTDTMGHFVINCLPTDKIKVSAHGFASRKVKVQEKTKIVFVNLNLKQGAKNPEIAVGYGHIKDSDKLFSVASLQTDNVAYSSYSNMYQLLQTIPGVTVSNRQVIIRGKNSINYSSDALIVVDGSIEDSRILETIRPFNVKSIDVLKDGSSSIYGSRGASGVVLITTKKGGE